MADDDEILALPPADSETTCTICYAEFLDPADLKIHLNQVHASRGIVQCHFCSNSFASLDDYARHIRDAHILSLSRCNYCTKVFQDVISSINHEKKHRKGDEKVFNCSQCYFSCLSVYDLEKHEFEDHNNNQDGVLLNKCYPNLSSYLNINTMTFIQSLSTKAVYVCTSCNYSTPSAEIYIGHLQKKLCRSFTCDKCYNVYQNKRKLSRHLCNSKSCSGDGNKVEKVKKCFKCHVNIDPSVYSKHVRSCNPPKCHLCDVVFASMYELTAHQTKEHPVSILMQRCKFCRREYVGKVQLEKHVKKVHTNEMHLFKYMCVYCEDMYFKHPLHMFRHFFSRHQDLRPFCCKICDMTFRARKSFTVHIKINHKSEGFVEFDDNYHAFFTATKSANPFQPKSLFGEQIENEDKMNTTKTKDEADSQNDTQTEAPTDIEDQQKIDSQKKPLKLRYKEQKKSNEAKAKSTNVSNENRADNSLLVVRKRKLTKRAAKKTAKNANIEEVDTDLSEDEPLIKIKKQKKRLIQHFPNRKLKKATSRSKKISFICSVCSKNCYTFQNYNHHMSLHNKNETKSCILCSKTFTSKSELNKHTSEAHSKSRLTETLKNLLERRKFGKNGAPQLTPAEKFRKSINKVKSTCEPATVSIKEVNDISVQKFIENFTPEETTSGKTNKKPEISTVVSTKVVNQLIPRPPLIKMTKFTPKPMPTNVKLAMPVRFKSGPMEPAKVKVRLVQKPIIEEEDHYNDYNDDNNDALSFDDADDQYKAPAVPEVAEEVMLEEAPAEPKQQYKIVIPKLPEDYRIAHLMPQAPYYKIVKMKEVLKGADDKKSEKSATNDDADKPKSAKITLPCGKKLVNVNPLAHLLGDKPVDEIIGQKKKQYYKPRTSNFEEAIARALTELETDTYRPRRKRAKKDVEKPEVQSVSAPSEQSGL